VTTVETGPNGSYAVTVPLAPESAAPSGRVQVAASFDGAETNLDAARATTTFDVDQAGDRVRSARSGSRATSPCPSWWASA